MSLNIRVLFVALVLVAQLSAVTIGQIDDFQDGTTMGWFVPGPSPNPPANVPTGGPAGAGDAYLSLVANGSGGAGGRLAVLNDTRWTGNFSAITGIRMNVRNFGPSDLYLRLLFEDFPDAGGPPDNLALSADAVLVPAGGDWTSILFRVTAADLVSGGFGTVAGALADTDTLRIFHNPDPSFPGPGVGIPLVNASLGVDDIATEGIPEPGTVSLLAAGLVGLLLANRVRCT
jgi:hypothetical protein